MEYKQKIESELNEKAQDVLTLLDKTLLTNCTNPEARVFYLKMKGDYYRYQGEFMQADQRKTVIDMA